MNVVSRASFNCRNDAVCAIVLWKLNIFKHSHLKQIKYIMMVIGYVIHVSSVWCTIRPCRHSLRSTDDEFGRSLIFIIRIHTESGGLSVRLATLCDYCNISPTFENWWYCMCFHQKYSSSIALGSPENTTEQRASIFMWNNFGWHS